MRKSGGFGIPQRYEQRIRETVVRIIFDVLEELDKNFQGQKIYTPLICRFIDNFYSIEGNENVPLIFVFKIGMLDKDGSIREEIETLTTLSRSEYLRSGLIYRLR